MFNAEGSIQAEAAIADELQPLRAAYPSSLYGSQRHQTIMEGEDILEDSSRRYSVSNLVVPNEVQLWRIENIAVPACYLTVGVVQGLSGPLMNVYPLDLGATEAAQVTLSTVIILPATIKIFYGFLSDCVPILGARRKPYMMLGWWMVSCTMISLLVSSDLSMSYDKETGAPMPPTSAPSIESLSGLFFLLGVGLWMADVMGDSLVVSSNRLMSYQRVQ